MIYVKPDWVCPNCGVEVYYPAFMDHVENCPNCGWDGTYEPDTTYETNSEDPHWIEYKIDGGEPNPDYVPPKRKRK